MKNLLANLKVPGVTAIGSSAQKTIALNDCLKPFGIKKIVALLLALLFSLQFVTAQKIDTSKNNSPQVMHDFYMQKHDTNKAVGFVFIGSGTIMMVLGVRNSLHNLFSDSSAGETLFVAGGVTALASIPFFISAGANKRKASLSLNRESVSIGDRSRGSFNYPAIAFKIRF